MKCRYIYHKVALIAVIAAAIGCMAASARRDTWDDDARKRKASNIFIYATTQFAEEKYSLYDQLLKRAYALDPDDPDIRFQLGIWTVLTNAGDSATYRRGFDMAMDAYQQKPMDYFEGLELVKAAATNRNWNDHLRVTEMLAGQYPSRNEIMMQLGQSYLMQTMLGDSSFTSKAMDVFSGLESRIGHSPQITEMKIRTLATTNDTSAIIRELLRLDAASPSDIMTSLTIAGIFSGLNLPDSALRYYDKACEIDPTNGTATLMRAHFLESQGDSARFEAEAMRAIKSPDLDFEEKAPFIVDFINEYAADTAMYQTIGNMFDILLDINSGEPDVYRLYAEYLAHTGRLAEAADQMKYAVALQPSERSSWLFLANLNYRLKNFLEGAEELAEASRFFPADPDIATMTALYYSFADKSDKGIAVLESFPDSIITDPERLSAYNQLLGDLYYKTNRAADAFAAYTKALRNDPTNYMAMNNLAYYMAECDTLLDQAEDYIVRVVRHDPENVTYLDTYAWILYKQGNISEARQQIDRVIELTEAALPSDDDMETDQNSDASLYDHAGDIYFSSGDKDRAVEFWKKALEHRPENPDSIKEKIKHRRIITHVP